MRDLLPNGVLGVAVTGLIASFMAGMAANVSGFNTVFTYDIWQTYVRKDRSDDYYLRVGRIATVGGIVVGIGTAFIAAGFSNIMNYIQALFSVFNAPLFATFIVGMFWKRMTAWAGFWSLLLGTAVVADAVPALPGRRACRSTPTWRRASGAPAWRSSRRWWSPSVVTLVTPSKPENELRGLVYGLGGTSTSGDDDRWPATRSGGATRSCSAAIAVGAGPPALHPGLVTGERSQCMAEEADRPDDERAAEGEDAGEAVGRGPAVRRAPGDRWAVRGLRRDRHADRDLRQPGRDRQGAGRTDQPLDGPGDAGAGRVLPALAVVAPDRGASAQADPEATPARGPSTGPERHRAARLMEKPVRPGCNTVAPGARTFRFARGASDTQVHGTPRLS